MFLFDPGWSPTSDAAFLGEMVVFVAVTALVASLAERGSRARLRALTAESAAALARADLVIAQEQSRHLEQLRRSEDETRVSFETVMDPIEILDPIRDADGRSVDYRFRAVNAALTEVFGRP